MDGADMGWHNDVPLEDSAGGNLDEAVMALPPVGVVLIEVFPTCDVITGAPAVGEGLVVL